MRQVAKSLWKRWLSFWDVMLAFVFGAFLFAILNFLSAGVFTSLFTVGLGFAVLASLDYLLWGRMFSTVGRERRLSAADPTRAEVAAGNAQVSDDFIVPLNDSERSELIRLLERPETAADTQEAALRRNLLSKLRMFGA